MPSPIASSLSPEGSHHPLRWAFEALPSGMQSVLGSIYRWLPESRRRGSRYAEFRSLAEQTEGWSWEDLRGWQLKQLRALLHHAANHCPFYQRRFGQAAFRPEEVRELEDIRNCPILEHRDLAGDVREVLSRDIKRSRRIEVTTLGPSGGATAIYLQKEVTGPAQQAFLHTAWGRGGYSNRARLAVVVDDEGEGRSGGPVRVDPLRGWLVISSREVTAERMPECLRAIERFKPDFLHASPSGAARLGELVERGGQPWHVPLRGLLADSEPLSVSQKQQLERTFNCRLFRYYDQRQHAALAAEGRQSQLYYFWPTYGLVEFGAPDEHGLCELIATAFHNRAMPLIRYRTGDLVRLADPRTDGELEFPWPAVSAIARREPNLSPTSERVAERVG